jgi:DNA-binding response OmpR family regulator
MQQADGSVLVVEDDPEVNELVGTYAQIAGFEYDSALTGGSALEKARAHAPVLIILDVMLPDLDGFEVCRQLKLEQRTRKIPVVMLTALDGDEYRNRGCQCGAVEFLTKPFDPDRLMDAIRQHAGQNGNGAQEEE